MADNNSQNSGVKRKRETNAYRKPSLMEKLMSIGAPKIVVPPTTQVAPDSMVLPTLKQAREAGSPVDSLLVEEIRRRNRFMEKAPKRKVPFQR